ncbi:MAG: hypothetical protein S4CHLAM37_02270 [Chlamydiia bacterium]|nr:hypothetical protein [Chlamydiia bacterium]
MASVLRAAVIPLAQVGTRALSTLPRSGVVLPRGGFHPLLIEAPIDKIDCIFSKYGFKAPTLYELTNMASDHPLYLGMSSDDRTRVVHLAKKDILNQASFEKGAKIASTVLVSFAIASGVLNDTPEPFILFAGLSLPPTATVFLPAPHYSVDRLAEQMDALEIGKEKPSVDKPSTQDPYTQLYTHLHDPAAGLCRRVFHGSPSLPTVTSAEFFATRDLERLQTIAKAAEKQNSNITPYEMFQRVSAIAMPGVVAATTLCIPELVDISTAILATSIWGTLFSVERNSKRGEHARNIHAALGNVIQRRLPAARVEQLPAPVKKDG